MVEADVNALLKMAKRGNKIMLVSNNYPKYLEDTLRFYCTYSHFSAAAFKKYASSIFRKDSIYWIADSVYSRQLYRCYPQFCNSYFRSYDSLPVRKLAEKDMSDAIGDALADSDSVKAYNNYHPLMAMVRPWGKGKSCSSLLRCCLRIMACWTGITQIISSVYCRRWGTPYRS